MGLNSDDEASDDGETWSRSPRDNVGGTTGNDRHALDSIMVDLPFSQHSCPLCLSEGIGNFLHMALRDTLAHLETKHPNIIPTFICSKCNSKESNNWRSIVGHTARCKGVKVQLGEIQCPECARKFLSKISLGLHMRSKHPVEHNKKLLEGRKRERKKTVGTGWTREEEDELARLEMKYAGNQRKAAQIATELKSKSNKQIRDKLAYNRRRARTLTANDSPDDEEVGVTSNMEQQSAGVPPPDLEYLRQSWLASNQEGIMQLLDSVESLSGSSVCAAKISELLRRLLRSKKTISQENIDEVYNIILTRARELAASGDTSVPAASSGTRPCSPKKKKKKSVKKYIYARSQDLYKNSPSTLAKYIVDDVRFHEDNGIQVERDEIKRVYENLWGTPGSLLSVDCFRPVENEGAEEIDVGLIGFAEVEARIDGLKDGATGTDGISKVHLKKKEIKLILTLFFGLVTASGVLPSSWGANKTVLLKKKNKSPLLVNSYRPITISSMVERTFWGIVDQRIRSKLTFFCRQKGFVKENGTYTNIHIINELLHKTKTQGGKMIAVFLDLCQAFDRVPHEAIAHALKRRNVSDLTIKLIMDSYASQRTLIKTGGADIPLHVKRGVKQGDPLSPLIFNLIIEPLLVELNKREGIRVGDEWVSCLAFADDLTLLAGNRRMAQRLINIVEKYLHNVGLEISPSKSACFELRATADSSVMEDPELKTGNGERISAICPGEHITYLGAHIQPWGGSDAAEISLELNNCLLRLKKLKLKPHQKIRLLTGYVLPHFMHPLVCQPPGLTKLREMDRAIRVYVKSVLHQQLSRADASLYASCNDGGLGIPRLEWIVTAAALKNGLNFLNSQDPLVKAITLSSKLEERLKRMSMSLRINYPCTIKDVEKFKRSKKKEILQEWKSLTFQGKAVDSFTDDPIGNYWLKNPTVLKSSRYITALKMRTNQVGLRVSMNIAQRQEDIRCRKCKAQPETLGHVIGLCTYTKPQRLRRHDEILTFVMDEIARGDQNLQITKEPSIVVEGKMYKPDLVLISRERVLLVDISVRLEDGAYLEAAKKEKIVKYSPLLKHLCQTYNVAEGKVIPIIVGSRGGMPRSTVQALKYLGVQNFNKLLTISLIALRNSIEIYHSFVDYDGVT